ncbi:MAG: aspartate aminotransferase family protein [Candidatus Omnitrophica bacterium]|nr:aspartate aminotransferase family protein [Candidatus Omnitrophota bacterium]MDD5488109.1 aspartate aminotransferase family protein [Candidatus Omnitrophota bacterium]
MNTDEIKELYGKYVMATYTYEGICLVKGEGSYVEDVDGKKYLDFFPGWAVSGIGHRHPKVLDGINRQLGRILHVSNNYFNDVQPVLAKRIIENSFPGKVFFANSGAEANEAAIKLARKYGNPSRFEIITMERSFHGRTLATITATGQDKVKKGFSPLPEGFRHVPFNDINAVRNAFTDRTVAVLLEPVQGEGGINVPDVSYMRELRDLCTDNDVLLMLDEVQTCMGRTGEMFAYKNFGIEPDVMTLAKSLGGGLPIGAMVAGTKFSEVLTAGTHASTFGGGSVVCAAGLGVFDAIEEGALLDNARKMGAYLRASLEKLSKDCGLIGQIKGLGLMLGVVMNMEDATAVPGKCAKEGLLINCTQKNILRIMPPITVTEEEIDEALDKLSKVLEAI